MRAPLSCSKIVSALPTSAIERAGANISWKARRPIAGMALVSRRHGIAGLLGRPVAIAPLEPDLAVGMVLALLEPGTAAGVVDQLGSSSIQSRVFQVLGISPISSSWIPWNRCR